MSTTNLQIATPTESTLTLAFTLPPAVAALLNSDYKQEIVMVGSMAACQVTEDLLPRLMGVDPYESFYMDLSRGTYIPGGHPDYPHSFVGVLKADPLLVETVNKHAAELSSHFLSELDYLMARHGFVRSWSGRLLDWLKARG